jgi:hypothetical protein
MEEYNYLIQTLLFVAYFGWVGIIVDFISKKDWFSSSFIRTYKWVIAICAFFAILGGSLEYAYREFIFALKKGSIALEFLPFFIGGIIGLMLFPLFLTYIVRLISPIFKKIHESANK